MGRMNSEDEYVSHWLNQYKISNLYGFLYGCELPDLPVQFNCWLEIANDLPKLLAERTLRDLVDKMCLVSTAEVSDYLTLRHAHLVIALLTNGYVWQNGDGGVPESIPKQLAIPLMEISKRVELPPIICHADLVLTNYVAVDPTQPLQLGNIKLRYRISGDVSCDWFFLATTGVELACVPAIKTILKCKYCVERQLVERSIDLLQTLSTQIEDIRLAFLRMHEQLDGRKFYDIVRPYLNGWHETGMIYSGVSDEPVQAYGGSAAQCTGIQCIDVFLGIQHEPDKRKFLVTMRDYMPAVHRKFLYKLEAVCQTAEFVERFSESADLCGAYNDCVQAMVKLRSTHIQIVVKYITIQAAQSRSNSYDSLQKQGTGGQELLPFLKNLRSTTQSSLLDRDVSV